MQEGRDRPATPGTATGLRGGVSRAPSAGEALVTTVIDLKACNLLVVSDLHLSEGRQPSAKKFSRNEDFFFDEAFARLLDHYQRDPRWSGARWHLVIDGDFVDLLQVVTSQGAPSALRQPGQARFGLASGEAESAYKLGRVAEGHWLFFEALAAFLEAGHQVTVIRGNHDVEFCYPLVQQAFVAALQAAGQRVRASAAPAGATPGPSPAVAVAANLHFSDWFYFEPGLLWIEHGNRYDGLNSFERWLAPLLPRLPGWPASRQDEIDLPFGSLFVRYLFNSIEQVEPFADNVKPASKFISWIFRRHPITALRFAFGDGRHLLDRVRRAWRTLPADAYQVRDQQHRARLAQLAAGAGLQPGLLQAVDDLAEPSLLRRPSGFWTMVLRRLVLWHLELPLLAALLLALVLLVLLAAAQLVVPGLPVAVREALAASTPCWLREAAGWALLVTVAGAAALAAFWKGRGPEGSGPSSLKDRAARVAELLGVRFVVMGHTHDPELHDIGTAAAPGREYFNTGTWTPVFSEEERLIREDVELAFLEGVRSAGTLRLKLQEWDDAAGEPRLLKLFRDG